MAKTTWGDLLARFPNAPLVIAVLPDSSEGKTLSDAHPAQRLLVRLIRKVSPQADFAVTVSRQNSQREVQCAFEDGSDARLFANITNASVFGRGRYSFALDELAEERLAQIAGPPQPHRKMRTTSDEGWQA